MEPLILHEDDDLLVVNKPAGLNTHSPSPYANEGVYDWLKHRQPRWSALAIIQRLDKETSGVLIFAKSALANRELTEQFTGRTVRKTYLLWTDKPVPTTEQWGRSALIRAGDKYRSSSGGSGLEAQTRFVVLGREKGRTRLLAEPRTGRTHQIRVHAADLGFPILGDTLYDGTAAERVYLHAWKIELRHPATGERVGFEAAPDFDVPPRLAIRMRCIDGGETDTFRLVHGASDGWSGLYVERWGDYLLSQSDNEPSRTQLEFLRVLASNARGLYHKILTKHVRQAEPAQAAPRHLWGETAPEEFTVRENGIKYQIRFHEGYSVGLFLDQRDNRRRLAVNHVASGFPLIPEGLRDVEVLNAFAYTGGFSVCAALAGARVTTLDLSKKYLEWAKRNFEANGLDPVSHDFVYGDVFDWLGRLGKKQRQFGVVLLDPPTFSQSKTRGVFRAERDYGELVSLAARLLKPGGVLFASTNAARLAPEVFLNTVRGSVRAAGRAIETEHYVPQPIDFPISRDEPAYLKTVWMRL